MTSGRRARLAILAVLLVVTAVSTWHGVTADRWSHDLAITRALQHVDVGPYGWVLFWMGIRGVAGLIMAVTCAWLWLRGERLAALMLILMLPLDATSFPLRELYGRPRPSPELVVVQGGPQGFSYPSGTTLHTMFFYGFMIFLLPRLTASRRVAYGVGAVLVGWIAFQGAWVIHHGRHWFSDAVGGYLYGATYLAVFIELYLALEARLRRGRPGTR